MRTIKFNFVFLLVILAVACNSKQNATTGEPKADLKEDLVKANIAAVDEENLQIESLILRNAWKMQKTGTGLRYEQLEQGNGPHAKSGKLVTIDYEIRLVDGTVAYTSQTPGPRKFTVGSGGVESGLEEGILLMKKGDKYRFVMPSYLAHGLTGDQDKIPPKATLIYTVKLIEIQ